MRLENLTEGNGSYPTQTAGVPCDPFGAHTPLWCGSTTRFDGTAPTPRHRDLRPVHKGEEIVAQGRPGPSYLPPTANHRHASQPPPERAQRARAEPEEKKKVRRTSERGRAQRAKRAAAVRATHAEAFFFRRARPWGRENSTRQARKKTVIFQIIVDISETRRS
jgi:hypothetical protein